MLVEICFYMVYNNIIGDIFWGKGEKNMSVKRYFIPIGVFLLIAGIVLFVREYVHNADCAETIGRVIAIYNGGKIPDKTGFGSPLVTYEANGRKYVSEQYEAPYGTYTVGESSVFYYKVSDPEELTELYNYKEKYIMVILGLVIIILCRDAVKGWLAFPKKHPCICAFTAVCIIVGLFLLMLIELQSAEFLGGIIESLLLFYGAKILIPVNFIVWFIAAVRDTANE